MSELITDEIREAAADAILEAVYGQELPEAPIDLVWAALEAAAPRIAARAWSEGFEAAYEQHWREDARLSRRTPAIAYKNPYEEG
jgi:hypothetical protein